MPRVGCPTRICIGRARRVGTRVQSRAPVRRRDRGVRTRAAPRARPLRRERVLVVLAKMPRSGRAKVRLARTVGSGGATALARAFLADTLALSRCCGADEVVVAYAPAAARPVFAKLAPDARLIAQPRAGFGARLRSALDAGHAEGKRVVLIGTDSPT